MSSTLVYVIELRPGRQRQSTVRVERHQTRPATGLWNRLRRRRWVTDVEMVGIYMADVRDFQMTRNINGPSTLRLSLSGHDPITHLTTKEATHVDD